MRPIVFAYPAVLLVALWACSACTDPATTEPDTGAMYARGTELLLQGDEANLREAIALFRNCLEVDPEAAPCHAGLARTYASISGNYNVLTGDTGRAKQEAAELIASDPERPGGYWSSANIHAREGEYEQAAEHLLKQIPLMDGDIVDEVALLGHVYARMGRDAEARQMLERLDQLSLEGRYVAPANKAWIHAGLGEVDETLDLLREGIETHANRSGLDMTGFAFVFEPVSSDPRFGALLEELGLAE